MGCRVEGVGFGVHRGVDILGDAVDVDHDIFLLILRSISAFIG